MYKIGDFSKLTGASIRTLRYYDQIDLFKPDEVDLFTGYRYYSEKKLKEFQIIIELKTVGFTLEEIKKYWNKFSDQIMLNKKQQILEEVNNINKKIKKIDELRSRLKDGKINFENVKQPEEIKVKTLIRNDMIERKIVEEEYDTYIKFNGQKACDKAAAIALKQGIARYYVIYINNEFVEDFEVFNTINNTYNYLALEPLTNEGIFDDSVIMNLIFEKLSEVYPYITMAIFEDMEEKIVKAKEYGFKFIHTDERAGYKYLVFKKILKGNH